MDFAAKLVPTPSAASRARIRFVAPQNDNLVSETCPLQILTSSSKPSLDDIVLQSSNKRAAEIILGSHPRRCPRDFLDKESTSGPSPPDATAATNRAAAAAAAKDETKGASDEYLSPSQISLVDSSLFPDQMTPQTKTIQPGQLVVIFESFDQMDFSYAKSGSVFTNRNGNFHHDDFLGKPFGCHIRSRNNRGYGFCYVLKPTPELWARSLNHRTQIVHELDASMIVHYLQLRPNMVVCESGTGSGALSHCLLRSIAPHGHLYTYEFNKARAETAQTEFVSNGVGHLVTVTHKDVCGKHSEHGGFERPGQSVDGIILDLPEPWLAIPHAAHVLRPEGRIATYSPCVEQSQKAVAALESCGFHSIVTKEFRLREYYVDDYSYEDGPPRKKRPPTQPNPHSLEKPQKSDTVANEGGMLDTEPTELPVDGHDTGAEADNEKSEYETEGEQASLATAEGDAENAPRMIDPVMAKSLAGGEISGAAGRKSMLVARPFTMMRGHTAFLTFATAGNVQQNEPNEDNKQGSPNI